MAHELLCKRSMRNLTAIVLALSGCAAPSEGEVDDKFFGADCEWEVNEDAWLSAGCDEQLKAVYDRTSLLGAWRTPGNIPVQRASSENAAVRDPQCHFYVAETAAAYTWLWNKNSAVDIEVRCMNNHLWLRGTLDRASDRSSGEVRGTLRGVGSVTYRLELWHRELGVGFGMRLLSEESGAPFSMFSQLRQVAGFGPGATMESCNNAADAWYEDAASQDAGEASSLRDLAEQSCAGGTYQDAWHYVVGLSDLAKFGRDENAGAL